MRAMNILMRHTNLLSAELQTARGRARAGFTMVELLVVIGISVLLFGLLLKPLVDSLSLTQQAQATAAAQDSARKTMEIMTRELGSAAYIYDNASYPVAGTTANATATASNPYPFDRFTNFLNLEVPMDPTLSGTPNTTTTIAHAYNAKLDIVLPRRQQGQFVDPTMNEQQAILDVSTGPAVVKPTDLLLPVAPGTTMIRYFVGLKNPEKHYRNIHEGSGFATGDDNTYVLYRAQFRPQEVDTVTGKYLLFDVPIPANSNITQTPIYDDPDFFRDVSATDVNWLTSDHHTYTGAEITAHHNRLVQWEKISQRVIGAPQVDLLLLPHTSDGKIGYDAAATTPFAGIAHYGGMTDPVTGTQWPVVNTSVTFKPTVTNDATPATTTDYASAGVVLNAADNNGLPYIPTVYQTSGQSWNEPFTVNLYPANYGGATTATYFRIERSTTDVPASQIAAGDLVEYQISPTGNIPVYNISFGAPVKAVASRNFVPAVVNPDSGTISFAVNALPDPDLYAATTPTDLAVKRANTEWPCTVAPVTIGGDTKFAVDLKTLPKSPLNSGDATGYVVNAILTPGSVRVYGPRVDGADTSGLTADKILYTAVGPGETPGDNQYQVDYRDGVIVFGGNITGTVGVVWQYQSNLAAVKPANPISTSNLAAPMTVKVDYQTRDLIALNIGVRIYPSSNNLAQIVSASSNVKVGDSNR